MDLQRLRELAGIPSNMSNPSFEPETDVPENEPEDMDAGEPEGGDEGIIEEIRAAAERGANDPEEAQSACQEILDMINSENGNEEENSMASSVGSAIRGAISRPPPMPPTGSATIGVRG